VSLCMTVLVTLENNAWNRGKVYFRPSDPVSYGPAQGLCKANVGILLDEQRRAALLLFGEVRPCLRELFVLL
jgi:hypothetical protein